MKNRGERKKYSETQMIGFLELGWRQAVTSIGKFSPRIMSEMTISFTLKASSGLEE